jgi:hypothetical protein
VRSRCPAVCTCETTVGPKLADTLRAKRGMILATVERLQLAGYARFDPDNGAGKTPAPAVGQSGTYRVHHIAEVRRSLYICLLPLRRGCSTEADRVRGVIVTSFVEPHGPRALPRCSLAIPPRASLAFTV